MRCGCYVYIRVLTNCEKNGVLSEGAGRATLPQLFGCEQEDGILDQQANSLLKAVFSGASALFIESLEGLPDDRQKRLFRGTPAELGGFRSLALVPLQAEGGPIGLIISASVRVSEFPADKGPQFCCLRVRSLRH